MSILVGISVPPRVAVLGSQGMLGSYLYSMLEQHGVEVQGISRTDFDCQRESPYTLLERLRAGNVNVVVNCIAFHGQVSSLESLESMYAVNSHFPRQLADILVAERIACIHISTNGVFSGLRGNYTEHDIPDATHHYGQSKYLGESVNAMVLRTSIIGRDKRHRKHLLEWLLQQENATIQGFTNHLWNGVTVPTLADILLRCILEERIVNEVVHIHSPDTLSKHELITKLIAHYHLPNITVRPTENDTPSFLTLQSHHSFAHALSIPTIAEQIVRLSL